MAKVGLGLAKNPADAGDVGETTIGFSPEIDHFGETSLGKKIWVCLKIGYIPNYSHLIGIMIINHWV